MRPKILIWDYNINIKNSGGPAGYLYNIRKYLNDHKEIDNIYFIKDLLGLESQNDAETLHTKYHNIIKFVNTIDILRIWTTLNTLRSVFTTWYKRMPSSPFASIKFNEFDIIHFHVSAHLYKAKEILKSYKGKIVLTSHCPQPLSYEITDGFPYRRSLLKAIVRRLTEKKELQAWEYADYMMFPVKEAVRSYFLSQKLQAFIESHPQRLLYCPSSILDREFKLDNTFLQKEYNVPAGKFVIAYVGRHSEIKGYDQLKKLGELILDKFDNIYIIVAGNESPLQGLKHERWIELGWINQGNELIANADLFILPNKETYFDLVALEVLRSGTPLMLTRTGGNIYLENKYGKESDSGLFFYNYGDFEQQITDIKKLMKIKKTSGLEYLRTAQKKIFHQEFSMDKYLLRYIRLMESIM